MSPLVGALHLATLIETMLVGALNFATLIETMTLHIERELLPRHWHFYLEGTTRNESAVRNSRSRHLSFKFPKCNVLIKEL